MEYVIDLRWYLCKSSGTEAILDNHHGDREEFFTLASRLQRQNETVGLALLHHFLLKFASSFRFSSLNTLPWVICDMAIIASATFLATIAALTAHLLGVRSNQEEHEQTRAELKTIQTALRCLSVVEPVQVSLFILVASLEILVVLNSTRHRAHHLRKTTIVSTSDAKEKTDGNKMILCVVLTHHLL